MNKKSTKAKRPVVARKVEPVVGLFGRKINPEWEFYSATRQVEFARHELLSRGTETLQQFHAAQEAALMHLLNAIENLATGLASIHQPNPAGHAPARSAAEGR